MYKYETHLHTYPVSKCAKAGVRECLEFYKNAGYTGVFITNHFLDGNINIDKSLPYEEQIEFFFSDYEEAVKLSDEIGINVFCGVELSHSGTDFLIYGLDKQWYLDNPQIMDMKKSEELTYLAENGALVIQAHPFRETDYTDHVRLYPRHVHGVEVINAANRQAENDMAKLYAEHYQLLEFAGSDNHRGGNVKKLAGMSCARPISSELDFVQAVKNGEMAVFTVDLSDI